jgi:hypothetical protein
MDGEVPMDQMDGDVPMEIVPLVLQQVDGNVALTEAKQPEKYVIMTMKKLRCKTVFQNKYVYNLHCSAQWVIQTGDSSSGDRSKIIKWILPNMMKLVTVDELQVLEAPRPDADVDQSQWRTGIERIAELIENRLKETMQSDELKLKIREEKLSGAADTREMSVSAVETRLHQIQKARDQISQPSMASVFQNSVGTSSSTVGAGKQQKIPSQASQKKSEKNGQSGSKSKKSKLNVIANNFSKM